MAARGKAGKYQGSRWIRRERRLAIYLRDGMACTYCGAAVEEDGVVLSLDHVIPVSKGGMNCSKNLVTACRRCNSNRGDRDVAEFAQAVAQYLNHGVKAEEIVDSIEKKLSQPIDIGEALKVIERRGSWQAALKESK